MAQKKNQPNTTGNPLDAEPGSGQPALGQLLKVYQAAEHLNCSISTIRRLIREKKLPAYRVGRGVRIAETDLEDVLKPLS